MTHCLDNRQSIVIMYMNESSQSEYPDYGVPPDTSRQQVYAVIGILSILSVMGIAGNALVLYVFYQKKDKQVSTHFIIVLAFVDFTTCLVVIPYTIILESRDFVMFSDFFCKLYHFLITSNIPFSALIMVAIAIDRYLCICHPFLQLLNLTRAKVITVVLAVYSASIGVIVALMHGVYDYLRNMQHYRLNDTDVIDIDATTGGESHSQDEMVFPVYFDYDNPNNTIALRGQCLYNTIILSEGFLKYYQMCYIIMYLVCLAVVIVLYSLIYHSVHQRRLRRAQQKSKALPLVQLQNTEFATTVEDTLLTQVNGDDKAKPDSNGCGRQTADARPKQDPAGDLLKRKSTRGKDNNKLANLRTASMLFVVTLVFIITFIPAFLMLLNLIPYNIVVFYMYFANNVANPVIYSFMNRNFRDDLVKILCKSRTR